MHRCGRWHFKRPAQRARLFQDIAGVAVPAGFSACRAVVQAGMCGLVQGLCQHLGADVRQQFGRGGRTHLVSNHIQRLAFCCQAQHGLGEISAPRAINPTGAQNDVARVVLNCLLARQLGLAVDAQRSGGVVLFPGAGARTVKHVVGGEVEQPCTQGSGLTRHARQGFGIDTGGACGIGFCLVHCCVGGRVDDHRRCHRAYRRCQSV